MLALDIRLEIRALRLPMLESRHQGPKGYERMIDEKRKWTMARMSSPHREADPSQQALQACLQVKAAHGPSIAMQ